MKSDMDMRRRLSALLLAVGAAATAAAVPLLLRYGDPAVELPWLTAMAVFVLAAAYTRWALPQQPSSWWFALAAGAAALTQGIDGFVVAVLARGGAAETVAWLMFVHQLSLALTVISMAHLFGLFPEGRAQNRYEQLALRSLWGLVVLPVLVLVTRTTVLFPPYFDVADVANPYAIEGLAAVGEAGGVLTATAQATFAVGVVLLGVRYRRSDAHNRRRIRWLLVPGVFAAFAVAVDLALAAPTVVLHVGYIGSMVLVPVTIAVALLRPNLLDVDLVLRKSLVYGFLWVVIAVAYVVAAAGFGVAAGQRFSVGVAITLTVVATMAFQPARRWLEQMADRWVFGARTDPTQLITRLGSTLEDTVELERLLPRMASTLEDGLGLRWARVRLEPAPIVDDQPPVLAVPIVLNGERLGVVECGPKRSGAFSAEDEAVVTTLARQAALAVRNVRLTAELERSRARLVRAQDAERRRIERNIHDGAQQDLVALIAHTGHVRSVLRRDPVAGEDALGELQEGLRHVIAQLRELAHGIHPSVLGDRGLLEAVEALAARSSVPVTVRADPDLRGERFAEEVEGAGYFTVAEALANVSKHASATHAEVRLARSDGSLRIAVHDDGAGFGLGEAVGEGLANLAERLAALGGRFDVSSTPGNGTTVTAQLRVSGA